MIKPIIYGWRTTKLSQEAKDFFCQDKPFGLILFKSACESADQIRALVDDFRNATGNPDAPILIDQEGGRVQRLLPPIIKRNYPPMAVMGDLWQDDPRAATRAAFLTGQLTGIDLARLGITVNCAPVLDLYFEGAHDIIGDRAFSSDPMTVATLARSYAQGLMSAGVLPIIKHMPGHGRAMADSHEELPQLNVELDELMRSDFMPFKALHDMPLAMTAHILFDALDPELCATQSPKIISEVIRGVLGFHGVIISDDVNMKALKGHVGDRIQSSLLAGCDLVLECSGDMDIMMKAGAATSPMTKEAYQHVQSHFAVKAPQACDEKAAVSEWEDLLSSWMKGQNIAYAG